MHAEPGAVVQRVDQARKRRAPGQREVAALAAVAARHRHRRQAGDARGQRGRAQPGAVDQAARAQPHRPGLTGVDLDLDAAGDHAPAAHPAAERKLRAAGLRVGLQREHQRVAVDDAAGRRVQRRAGGKCRLERARGGAVEPGDVVHAVGQRLRVQRAQGAELGPLGGHHQLAAAPVADAARGAVVVEPLPAAHAQPGLERAAGVVQPAVHDLAAARADAAADAGLGLDDDDLAPALGEGAGDGQPDHAGADDERVDRLHAHRQRSPKTAGRRATNAATPSR